MEKALIMIFKALASIFRPHPYDLRTRADYGAYAGGYPRRQSTDTKFEVPAAHKKDRK